MDQNNAARSQLRVTMADGAGPVDSDPLADAVVDLVLEAIEVDPARVGSDRVGAGPFERPGSTGVLAARRAAPAVDRLGSLVAVARAAERYRRAVAKGKRAKGKTRKRARRQLFEALAAWEKVRDGPDD